MTEDHGFGRDALLRCGKRWSHKFERNIGFNNRAPIDHALGMILLELWRRWTEEGAA